MQKQKTRAGMSPEPLKRPKSLVLRASVPVGSAVPTASLSVLGQLLLDAEAFAEPRAYRDW